MHRGKLWIGWTSGRQNIVVHGGLCKQPDRHGGSMRFLESSLTAAGVRTNKASAMLPTCWIKEHIIALARREAEKEWDSSSLLFCLGKSPRSAGH